MNVSGVVSAAITAGPVACPEASGQAGYRNTTGRVEVPCYSEMSTISALWLGQSNCCPISASAFTPSTGVENFNPYDGRNYQAKEPLLGPEPIGTGAIATCWASESRDTALGGNSRVVVTNCAVGSTRFTDWYPGGNGPFLPTGARSRFVVRAMLQAGLPPSVVNLQIGESLTVDGTAAATGTAQILSAVEELRRNGCTAPVFLALSTYFNGQDNSAARTAIIDACADDLGIFLGPDTDSLDSTYRQADNIHFKDNGRSAAASLWVACHQAWLSAAPGRSLLIGR